MGCKKFLAAAVVAALSGTLLAAAPAMADTSSIEGTGTYYTQALNSGHVEEIYGNTRYDTAAKQAAAAYGENGSNTVIVAGGDSWADSLAATSLAGALDAPVLLTEKDSLPEATSAEIAALKSASGSTSFKIIIVGGTGVISNNVQTALAKIAPNESTVTRLAGSNRYDTQMEIYNYGKEQGAWNNVGTIILATGTAFADALSVSPIAFSQKMPIFLVGADGTLTSDQTEAIIAGGFTKAIVVGGTSAIPNTTLLFTRGLLMRNGATKSTCVIRLAGDDRIQTSAKIATWAVDNKYLSWDNAAFATSASAPDALGGSVLQGKTGSVLLLTANEVGETATTLAEHKDSVSMIRFFGGGAAINGTTREAICALFNFDYVDADAYTIMGPSTVTVQQMVDYYNEQGIIYDTFPDSTAAWPHKGAQYNGVLADGGAATIEEFCQILYEEANAEGVRAEVVFCQAMVESGWLQYTGNVLPDTYNFAGMGAIDSDPCYNAYCYENVRMGLRAQVQHLKAYASTDSLVNDIPTATNKYYYPSNPVTTKRIILDGSRYDLVVHGSKTTVQELSGAWASGSNYDESIMGQIMKLKDYD